MTNASVQDAGAPDQDAHSHDYSGYYGVHVGVANHADGGGYLFRRNELIVAVEDADDLGHELDLMNQTFERVEYSPRLVRLFLGDDTKPVCELVTTLRAMERGQGQPPFRVYPNHVLYGNSHGFVNGGPGDSPRAAEDELSPPPPPPPGATDDNAVRVAVLDNGEFFKHSWLENRVERVRGLGPTSTSPDDRPKSTGRLSKYTGHGTFVTGVVLQHVPAAKVVVVKILNELGQATDIDVANALRLLPMNVKVALLSGGGTTHGNLGTPAIEEALSELWARRPELQVVAPACNYASDIPCFPAALNGVIAVAAIGAEPGLAAFSNFGSWVDVCASGVGVRSTFVNHYGPVEPHDLPTADDSEDGAATDEETAEPDLDFQGWAYWSGTCFAAARVAGAIADRIADTGESPAEAAYRVVRGGRARRHDGPYDMGVPVYPQSWA